MTVLMQKTNDAKVPFMKGYTKNIFMTKGKPNQIKSMVMNDSEDEEKMKMKMMKPRLER
jgi:hypothetical protein